MPPRTLLAVLALAALPLGAAPPAAAQTPAAAPAARAAACPARPVNPNVASVADLTTLGGIGEARAKAIVDGRPYGTVEAVRKAVPQAFDGIRPCLAVETANINAASATELVERLPGIGQARARAIVEGRPYRAPEELVSRGILTQGVLDGVRPLLTFK